MPAVLPQSASPPAASPPALAASASAPFFSPAPGPLPQAVTLALAAYGLAGARATPLSEGVHATFRIDTHDGGDGGDGAGDGKASGEVAGDEDAGDQDGAGSDAPPRYLLRLYGAASHGAGAVRSEVAWLESLRREAGLLVPEPVAAADGSMVFEVAADGGSGSGGGATCHAALFRWLDGKAPAAVPAAADCRRLGDFMARLHRHAERCAPPPGSSGPAGSTGSTGSKYCERPRYDLDRLLGGEETLGAAAAARAGIRDPALAGAAAAAVRPEILALGEGRDVFGLIHGDLQVTNFLFAGGRVAAIDFADCGWGYYPYDIATTLLPLWGRHDFAALSEAFLRGYRQVRPLPPAHRDRLESFLAARAVFVLRWTAESWHLPAVQRSGAAIVPRLESQLRAFLDHRQPVPRPPAPRQALPPAVLRRASPRQPQPAGAAAEAADAAAAANAADAAGTGGADAAALLSRLGGLGIRLWVEEGRLCFLAPQGALSAELRSALAARRAELVGLLRTAAGDDGGPQPPPLRPAGRDRDLPLSFAQQRLWLAEQIAPGNPAYNLAQIVRLRGSLAVARLADALTAVVRRHEALRTTIGLAAGQPVQRIAPPRRVELPVADLGGLPAARREAEARALADREVLLPFDLARGPLARFRLLRLGPAEHHLLSAVHHLVSDGWSTGVLVRELAHLYAATLRGLRGSGGLRGWRALRGAELDAALPPLAVQYADFACWQRDWLQGEVLAAEVDWWRRQLADAPDLLELPADRPRPPVRSNRGGRIAVALPADLAAALAARGRRAGATPFMTLLAVFATLLFRHSGREDMLIGSAIANRNRTEIEPLIGFFVNNLALRVRPGGGMAFDALLAAVRQTTLDAYHHQDLPFEKLVEALRPRRDPSQTPLFQVILALQNAPLPAIALPGLTVSLASPEKPLAQYDLELALREGPAGLGGACVYSPDLFDAATIHRLLGHFALLAEAAASGSGRRLEDLPLLSAAERHMTLCEWNDSAVPVAHEVGFPAILRTAAGLRPEAVAAVHGVAQLTYAALDRRAGALAMALAARGVGRGEPVGLLCSRGLDWLVAVVGILRAGGVYLPLNPRHPARRQAQILEQSGAGFLLASGEGLAVAGECLDLLPAERRPVLLPAPEHWAAFPAGVVAAVPAGGRAPLVPGAAEDRPAAADSLLLSGAAVDRPSAAEASPVPGTATDRPAAAGTPLPSGAAFTPPPPTAACDLAYTIYTSGSTGQPKGAMIEQRGMVNHLALKILTLGLGAADRVAQTAAATFDISIWQLLAGLAAGGCVEILDDETVADPERLLTAVAERQITVLEVVPSQLRVLLEAIAGRPGGLPLPQLRWLIPNAETLPPELCAQWLARYPAAPMVNPYGATECSDDITHAAIRRWDAGAGPRVSIGRPVVNMRLHVLDRAMAPLPIGVPGELWIGGAGVGRGYLGEPARTAETFLPDPFGPPGARLYRTGDLGRQLTWGEFDFLGRRDHQVKVNGFRVEPEEIAACLGQHPAVRESVVLVEPRPDASAAGMAGVAAEGTGGEQLVAYLTAHPGADPGVEELRRFLGERLPAYMVPPAFVVLEAMPLSPNGKIDRRALPAAARAGSARRLSVAPASEAPRTPLEAELALLWCQVLGCPAVGVHDSFFDMGGHSLLATTLVARVREALQVEIPLAAFFRQPTVAGLAEAVTVVRRSVADLAAARGAGGGEREEGEL
jgi:amino acid adenylation domain-containing protein